MTTSIGRGFRLVIKERKNPARPPSIAADICSPKPLSLPLYASDSFLEPRGELVQRHPECCAPLSNFNKIEPALPALAFADEWLVDIEPRG